MGLFERWLSLWIGLCIAAGIALGVGARGIFTALAALEVANVNLVVAALVWMMVFPMMVGVDFSGLTHIGKMPKGLVVTLTVNWLIKPFSMTLLGIVFLQVLFAGLIPAEAKSTCRNSAMGQFH